MIGIVLLSERYSLEGVYVENDFHFHIGLRRIFDAAQKDLRNVPKLEYFAS